MFTLVDGEAFVGMRLSEIESKNPGIEVTLAYDGWGYPYPPHEDPVVGKGVRLRVRMTNKFNLYNGFINTKTHGAQGALPVSHYTYEYTSR